MVLAAGSDVRADPVAPYTDPLFAAECTVHHFAEGEGPGGGGGATFCLGFREPWCGAAEMPLACGGNPGDACAVATARADADAQCDCTRASTHHAYVTCVAHVADDEVAGGQLPVACR